MKRRFTILETTKKNSLAIETSGKVAGVAIYKNDKFVLERYLDIGLTHSQMLMPMIENCMVDAQMDIQDIDYFSVDHGPGSFTGIRIGVCTANALAAACGKPVIAVNALEALTANITGFDGQVCALLDARSDRVYAGIYQLSGGESIQAGELFAGTVACFAERVAEYGNILFIGEGASAQKQFLAEKFGQRAFFVPEHLNKQRASSVAHIARKKICSNPELLGKEAVPLYLRMPEGK